MPHEDSRVHQMSIDPAVAEVVLRKRTLDKAVERVIKIESEPAVAKGENYLSVITRVRLKVVLGDGRIETRSLILKDVPVEESKRQLVASMGVFRTETYIYCQILKEMEALMKEYQDNGGIMWGRLIYYHPYTTLLFEDLKVSGFTVCRRQECLDLEHAHLVLHSLGRYHAMAKVLEHRGVIHMSDFKPYALFTEKELIDIMLHCGLKTLSEVIIDCWGSEWHGIAERVRMPLDVLQKKLMDLGTVDEKQFNALNHGDLWINNMMFSYDWKRRPVNVKFIDFQIGHYNSVCIDVTYFMFTSIEPEIRRHHYDSLLKTYSDSLLSSLSLFDYPGRRPTYEELAAEMERLAFFRLPMVTVFHGVMTADTTDAFDLEEILASGGSRGHFKEMYAAEIYRRRIGPDLLNLAKRGLI